MQGKKMRKQQAQANLSEMRDGCRIEIHLNDALSYNSIVELKGMFTERNPQSKKFEQSSTVACCVKSRKVYIILLMPQATLAPDSLTPLEEFQDIEGAGAFFILKRIDTIMKPTCLLQVSQRHLAIATGFLNEPSTLEVYNIFTGKLQKGSPMKGHDDMIDSMRLIRVQSSDVPRHGAAEAKKKSNPYIHYLLTMGRDNQLILWKLFDGRPMSRDHAFELFKYHEEKLKLKEHQEVLDAAELRRSVSFQQ